MNKPLKIRQRFDRRIIVLYAGMLLLAAAILLHLLDLQWLQHEKYALQAEKNRINVLPVLPVRGEIFDRNGVGLAVNHVAYQVVMIPERVEKMQQTLDFLADSLNWDEEKKAAIAKRIQHSRADRPVLLDDKLPWQQVSALSSRLHHLPGVDVQAGTYRQYPFGALTSHLIGYLALANERDRKAGFLSTEFVGRTGVERSFEETLHGKLGSQQEEVDAHGHRVAVLKKIPPVLGKPLRLSLDVDIQKAASEALGNRTGAVVVMDVHSGDVLALLSKPGYDTNHFITGLESAQWQSWLQDPRKPLLNRTTQAAYPPASTFKILVSIAGEKNHIPLIDGHTYCKGYIELGNRKFRCWKREGHGTINLHDAIVQSCDVYFYELGDELGMGRISEEAHHWGFGEKTGINLPPEARGNIPNEDPDKRRLKWSRGQTMIASIGQGAVTATPLQMARFAAAVANGGTLLKPLLDADAKPVVQGTLDIAPNQLQKIREAMHDVVATPHGTAYWHMRGLPWSAAGKTGTAQVVAMSQDEKRPSIPDFDLHKDHAWFMGFAPYEHPQIAFAVFVEHGGHGGSAAAPVAAAIIQVLATKEQEKPS